jgi:hypothetical protein
MIPVFDKIGYYAFVLYLFVVILSAIFAVAYTAAGVQPPSVAQKYNNVPRFNAPISIGNQTYNMTLQYYPTTQSVMFLSLELVGQVLQYVLTVAVMLPKFFADLAAAAFGGTPIAVPMMALATAVGTIVQAAAWMYIVGRFVSFFAGR